MTTDGYGDSMIVRFAFIIGIMFVGQMTDRTTDEELQLRLQ